MKKKAFLLAAIFSLTALCACNGGKGENTGSKGTKSAVVGITQDLDSLDPHKAVAAGTNEVLFNVFEGLVKPSKDGTMVPAVASEYQMDAEGKVYTFTLRDHVVFHNNKEVTAEDVIYSIKRCAGLLPDQDPEVKVESALSVIQTVEKKDDRTVVITLKEPNTEILGFLTCAIIPEDYKEQAKKPVGTGPYCFVSYEPLSEFVVERFENYYGEKPYLDKAVFKICASNDAAFMELLSGSIDIFPYLTDEQASQLTQDYKLEIGASNLVQAMFLNNDFEPFQNVTVRQALCNAIDRYELLDIVAGGKGNIIGSNMIPNFGVYYEKSLEGVYPYQPEAAKALLKEAGYDETHPLSFTITVPSNYDFHVATAQVLVEQLRRIGVKAEIKLVEWSAWLTDVYRGRNYEATVVGLDGALAPSDFLKRYRSTASNNFINYKSDAFDVLFDETLASVDEQKKIEGYKNLQKILTQDAASVYLQDPAKLVAVKKKFTGFTFYPVYVIDLSTIRSAD